VYRDESRRSFTIIPTHYLAVTATKRCLQMSNFIVSEGPDRVVAKAGFASANLSTRLLKRETVLGSQRHNLSPQLLIGMELSSSPCRNVDRIVAREQDVERMTYIVVVPRRSHVWPLV
jgi:hypothetical protein